MSGGVMEESRWRWRRPDESGPWTVSGWTAALTAGQLAEDGVTVAVTRPGPWGECPRCGRWAESWYAYLDLPPPWQLGDVGLGCTRAHACSDIPAAPGWLFVAEAVTRLLEAARPVFHAATAEWAAPRLERATWLAGQPPAVRRLANRLWTDNQSLSVADIEAAAGGILADARG